MVAAQGIRAGRAFVELGVSDKLTGGLRKAQRRLKAFGASVRSIGQRMVAVSAAAVTPFAVSTTVFAGFEQRMARVRALTGATGKDFDRLADMAKRLGESTVFSASQAADAMGFFALAGFDVDQILRAIGPTLNLAAAGQLEIAQAADIAAKIMAGMGLEADKLGGAVDVLTKAMTTANTDLVQLGDAMKFIGPIAKSAGIAFEEIVAAVQLLSNAGIQGEMAGTSLRGALLTLTSPSKEAAGMLKKLGVTIVDAAGDVRPLVDIIGDLERATKNLGSGKRLEVIGTIFQARQAAGVAELLSQGADKLRDYTAALRASGGTAARIAGVQLNTLTGNVTILRSALEGLAIAIGETLVSPLRVVAHAVTLVTSRFTQWIRANGDIVAIVATAVVGVGALGAGLVALGVAAQVAAFVFGGLASILVGVKAVFAAVVSTLGAIITPIGLVITAVVALAAAIVTYSGAAGDALTWLKDQFGRLRSFVSETIAGITDALASGDIALAARVLWLALKLAWQNGVASLNRVWLAAKRFFVETTQGMWYGAIAAAEFAWHGIEVAWIETTAFLSKTWTDFTSDLRQAWDIVQNWLTKRWLDAMRLFGQLTDEQAELAKQMADEDFVAGVVDTERQRESVLSEREKKRSRDRKTAAALHEATLAEIGRQFEAAKAGLDSDTDGKIAETQRRLSLARAELDKAIATARTQRRANEAGDGSSDRPRGLPNLKDVIANIAKDLTGRVSVTGTFNAAALAGLGAGDTADRTARATEQTARNTKRLVDAANTGGLTFV